MSRSVLIVDDDPAFRRLAARMLVAVGFTVAAEAADIGAAIDAAHASQPDACLVDVRLPDGDGVELAQELSALPWKPRILLTSSDAEAAVARGGDQALSMPFVLKEELPNAPLSALLGS